MSSVSQMTITPGNESFREYLIKEYPESADIKPATDWVDEVDELFDNPPELQGDTMPWNKTWSTVRFRPSELSIWGGINGHGKSNLNCQTLLWLAAQGKKVMIASMEMPPAKTINRMIKQAVGGACPDKQWRELFFKNMLGNMWFYDQLGAIDSARCLKVAKYSAEVLCCDHIQIDSLTKIKGMMGENSNSPQMDFVNDLQSVAFDHKTHIHLIAHTNKSGSEQNIPGKFDIKGSGGITDQADNVFIVWQNKEKRTDKVDHESEPDTLLKCVKQRHGEWEGTYQLWFGANGALQFVGREGERLVCPGFELENR